MSPALVMERFDIRLGPDDRRRLALEDFCSILDLPASAKYDGTIERMARGLHPLSTDSTADLDILFLRAVFAWLIADGEIHLKNLALLNIAEAGAKTCTSVRFAPLYDAVTIGWCAIWPKRVPSPSIRTRSGNWPGSRRSILKRPMEQARFPCRQAALCIRWRAPSRRAGSRSICHAPRRIWHWPCWDGKANDHAFDANKGRWTDAFVRL